MIGIVVYAPMAGSSDTFIACSSARLFSRGVAQPTLPVFHRIKVGGYNGMVTTPFEARVSAGFDCPCWAVHPSTATTDASITQWHWRPSGTATTKLHETANNLYAVITGTALEVSRRCRL